MGLDGMTPKGRAGRRLARDKTRYEVGKRASKTTLCRTPGCRVPSIEGEDYCKGCRDFFIGDDALAFEQAYPLDEYGDIFEEDK